MEPVTVYGVVCGEGTFWRETQAKAMALARQIASTAIPEQPIAGLVWYEYGDGTKQGLPCSVFKVKIRGGRPRDVYLRLLSQRDFYTWRMELGWFEPRGKRPMWHPADEDPQEEKPLDQTSCSS